MNKVTVSLFSCCVIFSMLLLNAVTASQKYLLYCLGGKLVAIDLFLAVLKPYDAGVHVYQGTLR
jgi:hypothetical protein